jgi:hypothetical protein
LHVKSPTVVGLFYCEIALQPPAMNTDCTTSGKLHRRCVTVLCMDYIALIYYAGVCAFLSFLAPRLKRTIHRLTVGAIVGLLAASLLPILKGALSHW